LKKFRKLFLWFAAGVIGFLLAFFLYLAFLQTYILSKREFTIAALLWIVLTPLVYLLLSRFLLPRLHEYTPHAQRNWLLLSTAVGILFALITRPPQLIFLLPKHTLQVLIPAGSIDRTITLEYAANALGGDISFSQLSASGNWKHTDSGLTYYGSEPASLTWSGRTGDSAIVVFSNSPSLVDIQVGWDGAISSGDISSAIGSQVSIPFSFQHTWQPSAAAHLLLGFTLGFLFLILTLFLSSLQLRPAIPVKHKKGYWLFYALPMIAVWGIWLLTFYPGIMTTDSVNQWKQVISGQFNDAHPVFHTLLLWLITRVWFSPTAVVIVQILGLSLTVAWGINVLDRRGLKAWASWTLVSIFALSPVNGKFVVSVWKDIFYSTAFLLFSILILEIVFTKGAWLEKKTSWLWLGLVSLIVGLTRHNGLPIPLLCLPILIIFYRSQWKQILVAGITFLGLYGLIRSPVYSLLKVERTAGAFQQIMVHHIAAHIISGDTLTPNQQIIANKILPEGAWLYDCCTNVKTMSAQGYSDSKNGKNAMEINSLAIQLFFNNPRVDISHQVCVTSTLWEIPSMCSSDSLSSYDIKESLYSIFIGQDQESGDDSLNIIAQGSLDKFSESKLPFLIPPMLKFLDISWRPPLILVFYAPSLFLLLLIYCTSLTSFRMRNVSFLQFLLPSMVQTLVLFVVNISYGYRYQYGVYLVNLLSLGLLVVSLNTRIQIGSSSQDNQVDNSNL
jgi:hypothetical protein